MYCSTYLCIYWLFLVCALTRDWTSNLGLLGWRSNQMNYLARVNWIFLLLLFVFNNYFWSLYYCLHIDTLYQFHLFRIKNKEKCQSIWCFDFPHSNCNIIKISKLLNYYSLWSLKFKSVLKMYYGTSKDPSTPRSYNCYILAFCT